MTGDLYKSSIVASERKKEKKRKVKKNLLNWTNDVTLQVNFTFVWSNKVVTKWSTKFLSKCLITESP